jgi:two-component system OmpR family response regulator
MQLRQYLSTGQLARLCDVTKHTVLAAIDKGAVRASRTPGGHNRIHINEAKSFLEKHGVPVSRLAGVMPAILVVDDDTDLLTLIRRALADGAFLVELAACGYDAGVLAERLRPQLIVLDVLLPDIDGRVICRQIKNNPVTAHTRVLAITGLKGPEAERSIAEAGFDDYLCKPFSVADLKARITALLRRVPKAAAVSQ